MDARQALIETIAAHLREASGCKTLRQMYQPVTVTRRANRKLRARRKSDWRALALGNVQALQ